MALHTSAVASPACCVAILLQLLLVLFALRPAAAAAAAAAAGALTVREEGAVMRTLRQRLADTGLTPNGWPGWQADDNQLHCSWQGVQCSTAGHVTSIYLDWETFPSPGDNCQRNAAPLLLPELARFAFLRQLILNLYYAPPVAAIPQEWGLPGAFPALVQLQLKLPTLDGPLPDFWPGALESLVILQIEASNRTSGGPIPPEHLRWMAASSNNRDGQAPTALQSGRSLRAALPASWGASLDVLPALEELTLVLHLVPPLPAAWSRGFRRLRSLFVAAPVDAPLPAAAGNVLPPEWAAGFPALRWLNLLRLGLTGGFPAAWADSGFPLLTQLGMARMLLSGTLPERVFETHQDLQVLNLELNSFTGTLPAAWAASQSLEGLSLRGNRLSGPLFPPAWLAPGAMPHAKYFSLDNNTALAGPLPAVMPWPQLASLGLDGTQVESTTIPEGWCKSPNAGVFEFLSIQGTHLGPELPGCLSTAMPALTVLSQNSTVARVGMTSKQPQRGSRAALAEAATVLLALLALASAAVFARHRRRLHSQAADGLPKHADASEAGLLASTEAGRRSTPQHDSPRGAGCHNGCTRRQRIQSLLRSQLSQPRQRIELVLLQQLPDALAHQVGSKQRGSQPTTAADAMPGAAFSGLQAVLEERRYSIWGSFGSSSSGGGSSTRGILEAAAARPQAPLSRQWGLDTDSLRLQPGELEMLTGPDGTLCLLGEGSSSAVYLGRLGSYEDVAVKVIELAPGMDLRHVWHEVSLLRACVHRRLVALLGVVCQGQLLMLVMELMRGGDLHSALQQPNTRDALRWAARGRQVALDVAEALAFLHSCSVQHADLKPSNVMLTCDLRAKLTDLGVAQQLGSRSRPAVGGTTQYAAPEQLLGLPCTTKADVYSLGVLLTVLCTGCPLAARGQLCLPTAPDDCPQAVLELIQECICPEPARRPTADEALRRLRAA